MQEEIKKLHNRFGYLQRQLEGATKTPAEEPVEPDPDKLPEGVPAKPAEDDFENYVDYVEALTDWKVDFKIAKMRQAEPAAGPAGEPDPEMVEFAERLNVGRTKYDDFDQVVYDVTVPLTHGMMDILKEMDRPDDVAYHLAKNRAECQSIAGMTPTRAAVAMAQIQGKLPAAAPPAAPPAAPAAPTKKVSNAPDPITPSSGAIIVSKDPSKMSQAEFEDWYNKEHGG